MMQTKKFPLDEVLTISTGRLVAARQMDGVYEILNWLTDDELYTHQLPRAMQECQPWLLRWYPALANVDTRELDKMIAERGPAIGCKAWVDSLDLLLFFDLPRIPKDDHEQIDPVTELQRKAPKAKIIVVESP